MAAAQGAAAATTGASRTGTKCRDVGPFKREDSPTYLTRVKKDIADFFADPPTGIFIAPDENNIAKIHAVVMGPSGKTPYENGFFEFLIRCPMEYPLAPPTVRFLTTDSGRVRFNPNLYRSGSICLNILESGWTPAQGIESLLVSIQSLLSQDPFYNQPGYIKAGGQLRQQLQSLRGARDNQGSRVRHRGGVSERDVDVAAYAEGRGAQEIPRVLRPLRGGSEI
ncbi:hypothetical protein MTO96_041059 [Rhipicephalus appendiculatus]